MNKFWYPKGGSERYAFLLKDLLESHGHEVVPFAMEDERNVPSPWSEFFAPHVDFWEARDAVPNQVRGIEKLMTVLWNRAAAEQLEKLLQEWKPDVAHLQNFAHQLSPSILPVLARHKIPVVWTLHDYELLCPNYRMYTQGSPCERCKVHRYWNAARFNCMESCAASVAVALEHSFHAMNGVYRKHINVVIAPSRFLAGKLAEWEWKGRMEVIPYFIREEHSNASNAGSKYHESTTAPIFEAFGSVFVDSDVHLPRFGCSSPPVDSDVHPVLFVGRLQEEKGVEDFITAARQLPNIPFSIIGSGALDSMIHNSSFIIPNLRWHCALSPEETTKRIAAARIVVVPSRWYENLPYVAMEAMAAGVPVIASRIGGLPELVRDGETGILVPSRDVEALAKAIQTLYDDPLRCAAMGSRAKEIAQTEYGSERHYERIMGVYHEVTKEVSFRRTIRLGSGSPVRRVSHG